jgi:DNA mismatch repair protein MutL
MSASIQPGRLAVALSTAGGAIGGGETPARRPIQVLPALVASQIAAGEVVERPQSIVKELIENALDARASKIVVELEQGGIELIRITDDGHGIPEAELALALTPHATSKVSTADDLERIGTMGFRGEALASIASVSRMSLRSRTSEMAGAAIIECEGDVILSRRPASGPVGTSVTVRNVFFNTPARRKFLRTPQTEQQRCTETVQQLAVAHPQIGFVLISNGRTTLDLPPDQSPRQRALAIIGAELEGELIEVSADVGERSAMHAGAMSLWGLIGRPSLARATASGQYVALNGRIIRDKTVQHAIKEAYRGLIEPGRHPSAVLLIEMDPRGVDVNVHPSKTEVRFRDSSMVHSMILRTLRDALQGQDLTAGWSSEARGHRFDHAGSSGGGLGVLGAGNVEGGEAPIARPVVTLQQRAEETKRFVEAMRAGAFGSGMGTPQARIDFAAMQAAGAAADVPTPVSSSEPTELLHLAPTTRPLQVHNSFLVTQDAQGMVIIDQHALHERVMFQKLLRRVLGPETQGEPLESQRLLVPVVVGVEPRAAEVVEPAAPLLTRLGIEATAVGPASVAVASFPSFLLERNVELEPFVSDLLSKLVTDGWTAANVTDPAALEAALAEVLDMMACKAAIKAGNQLSELEIAELVAYRDSIERISACPHGRPTSVRLSIRDLEKLFHRG